MKIIHLCLCGSYNEEWGYQDNIIPIYNKRDGHEVTVISSVLSTDTNNLGYSVKDPGVYLIKEGVKLIRIPFKNKFPFKLEKKFRIYPSLLKTLENEKPDFIFIHGLQFANIVDVVKYLKKNTNVRTVVDNHADFSNSATNWFSKKILHSIIWRYNAKSITPYTEKFYGVLPARVDFLINVYKVPVEKTELLVMGADVDQINFNDKLMIRKNIRERHSIKETDTLLITGGKIDSAKLQTLDFLKIIIASEKENLKVLIFGSIDNEIKEQLFNLVDDDKIQFIGWLNTHDIYEYFLASDLGVFPGRHSVLWEQAVGTGLPCLFKYWKGTTHVDVGGNCLFLDNDSYEEIEQKLFAIIDNENLFENMKKISLDKGRSKFSYRKISREAIQSDMVTISNE